MDDCLRFYAKKKPIAKGYILYDYIYVTFLKWQNFRNGGQISGFQGLRIGGWVKGGCGIKRQYSTYSDGVVQYIDCGGRQEATMAIQLHWLNTHTYKWV